VTEPEDGETPVDESDEPKKVFAKPGKPIAEMSDAELDAMADEMADALGLTFDDEEPPEGEPQSSSD
jgi:hypothetical protein